MKLLESEKSIFDFDCDKKNSADYTFDDITVEINGTKLTDNPDDAHVYCSSYFDFNVIVDSLKEQDDETENDITLSLTCVDTGEEVFSESYHPEFYGDCWEVSINDSVHELQDGRYLLTLTNAVPSTFSGLHHDGSSKYSLAFSILPCAKDMVHAMPIAASLKFLRQKEDGDKLMVEMRFDEEVTSIDRYEVACFDQTLVPMGNAVMSTGDNNRSHKVSAKIETTRQWLDRAYILYIYHNDCPYLSSTFTLNADGKSAPLHVERLAPSSLEYLFANRCKRDTSLSTLCEVEGCLHIKRKAFQCLQASSHDLFRMKYRVADIKLSGSYIFYGKGTNREREVVKAFVDASFHNHSAVFVDIDSIASSYSVTDPIEAADTCFDTSREIAIIRNADSLLWDRGRAVAKVLEKKMGQKEPPMLVFHATRAEIERLETAFPTLFAYIPDENRIEFETLTADDAIRGIERALHDRDLRLSSNAARFVRQGIEHRLADGTLSSIDMEWCADFVSKSLLPRFRQRMYDSMNTEECESKDFLTTVKSGDIDWQTVTGKVTLDDCLAEINAMTGLTSVKQSLSTIAIKARFDVMRLRGGSGRAERGVHHMVFTGNPGTGKTTVAKKVGKIFRSLGLLSKGEVVVTDRSQLVGRFIGQTEENVRNVLRQAQGNVLFIDEAYTLCDTTTDRKDFGYRVLECLLTVLTQKSPDMVVIMAGYEKEMDRMMDANQGLRGRFPYHVRFDDYSAAELYEIGRDYMSSYDLTLTDEAANSLKSYIEVRTAQRTRNFSNARWIEQFVDNALIPVVTTRLLANTSSASSSVDHPLVLPADISAAAGMMPEESKKQSIGFTFRA